MTLAVAQLITTHVARTNKLEFLADADAKALTPSPSELLADARFYASFFYMFKYIGF